MTGITVKGEGKQMILLNLSEELQCSSERNLSMSCCGLASERRCSVVLWLILVTIWCAIPFVLGECTKVKGERTPPKAYWRRSWVWMDFDYTAMHSDSMRRVKYHSLNECYTILRLLTSAEYELFQQDEISEGYSMDPRNSVQGTKAKCCLFVNCCFYNYNTIKVHIFMGNLRDK